MKRKRTTRRAQERKREECLRCAEGRGFQAEKIMQLVYELGVVDGMAQEAQRQLQTATTDDGRVLGFWGRYWRARYMMLLSLSAKLRGECVTMGQLLLEESTFLRSGALEQCITAARISKDYVLLTRLTNIRDRINAGLMPFEKAGYCRGKFRDAKTKLAKAARRKRRPPKK